MLEKLVPQALKDFWHGLPPQVQAGIVIVAAATASSLGKAITDPASCWQWSCWRHYLGAAVGAGIIAGKAFYMRPGPGAAGRQ